MSSFSHLTPSGEAHMVDVGGKQVVPREAMAEATLHCAESTIELLKQQALPKGDVLAVARVAAIQAAKRTSDLIPLCHQLPLESVDLEFSLGTDHIHLLASVKTTAKTGVEMEALTAVSVAALTIYDMMKAVDKSMQIDDLRVTSKRKG